MAEISRFYGILVAIFFRGEVGRHNLPHVHVRSKNQWASVDLDGNVLAGKLSSAARWLVRRWLRLHREEVRAAWDDARAGRTPRKIEPLE
jgi:hypothetical protein